MKDEKNWKRKHYGGGGTRIKTQKPIKIGKDSKIVIVANSFWEDLNW